MHQKGEKFQADQTFTNLPHLVSPFRESNTVQNWFPLTDESRYSTLFQSSLTNLCFELDLADVWECLGAAVQMGFTYAASVTFQAYRDVQKPHLSLSHCFHLGKIEDRKKTTEDLPALQKFEIDQVY